MDRRTVLMTIPTNRTSAVHRARRDRGPSADSPSGAPGGVGWDEWTRSLWPDPPLDVPARVIGIAASAGGLEALRRIVADLPADLPAAVCVVLHIPATGREPAGADPGSRERARRRRRRGRHAAFAPASSTSPPPIGICSSTATRSSSAAGRRRTASVRPPTRCSARWRAAGAPRRSAVILSGALGDGAAGAVRLTEAGGTVIVQDPETAMVPGMPESAIAATTPDYIARRPARSALVLDRLVRRGAPRDPARGRAPSRRRADRAHVATTRRVRGAARVPQAHPRPRLHRLQARQPRAPLPPPDGRGRLPELRRLPRLSRGPPGRVRRCSSRCC